MHFSSLMRYTSSCSRSRLPRAVTDTLVDALRARHKAITALQQFLGRPRLTESSEDIPGERDAVFATIVFFVNFSLVDTGRDGWRAHMRAAGKLVEALNCLAIGPPPSDNSIPLALHSEEIDGASSSNTSASLTRHAYLPQYPVLPSPSGQSNVLDFIASDFLAYYVWSGTLDTLTFSAQKTGYNMSSIDVDPASILPVLIRTEANSYHSCPAHLLVRVLRMSLLAKEILSSGLGFPTTEQLDSAAELFIEVQSFDTQAWAEKICASNVRTLGYVDEHEPRFRTHIALTYRATACLYLLLVLPSLQEHMRSAHSNGSASDGDRPPALPNTEDYAATILELLSTIPPASPLFRYTTWPVWMTGVETALPERRAWVMGRLQAMLSCCQWGMLESAMETLTKIWQLRDAEKAASVTDGHVITGETSSPEMVDRDNWLVQLRGLEIDCLIV